MVTPWAQELSLRADKELAVWVGEISGHRVGVTAKQFIPSPVSHHGFELTIAHQRQTGRVHFDRADFIPRGYKTTETEGGLNLGKTLMASLEYRYPIAFLDKGIGLYLLHAHLLRGSVFVDCGAGWAAAFDAAEWTRRMRTSVGSTLTVQTSILSHIPVELGISAGHKPRDHRTFAEFILRLPQ
jgi:outer membrane protein assembly factor BamA